MYRIKYQYEQGSGPIGDAKAVATFDSDAVGTHDNPRPKSLVSRRMVVTVSFNCPDANVTAEVRDAMNEAVQDGGRLIMLEAVFDDSF